MCASVIQTPHSTPADSDWDACSDKIQQIIDGIHAEFDGVVIRENVPPENLIVRGEYGEGVIRLKPGAVPKNVRSIRLVGEKRPLWKNGPTA